MAGWCYSNAASRCDHTVVSFHWVGHQNAQFLSCGKQNESSGIPQSCRLQGTRTPSLSWPPTVHLSPWVSNELQGDSEERKKCCAQKKCF